MPRATATRPAPMNAPTPASAPTAEIGAPAAAPPPLSGYRGLKVWQRAMDLAAAVHALTKTLPAGEEVLRDDLRRAASAIPAQIATGNSLYRRAEYIEHLSSAHGATARLECLLQMAGRVDVLAAHDTSPLVALASDVSRMLRGLARALQKPSPESEPLTEAAG